MPSKEEIKREKREKIEQEIRSIVLKDKYIILADNIRRRKRIKLSAGDRVRLKECTLAARLKRDGEIMYRVSEGTVLQVTRHGYYVEGRTEKGSPTKDFINKAHIINGAVKIEYLV